MSDFSRILTPTFTDLEIWKDLMEVVEEVFDDKINNPITQLRCLRDPDLCPPGVTIDREQLIAANNLLGQFYPDSSLFSDEVYRRFLANSPAYFSEKGTEFFIDFIAFNIGSVITLTPLWTEDYDTFVEEGDSSIGTTVDQGGTWYKTTHVQLEYDGFLTADSLVSGAEVQGTVFSLFRAIAPINLVLHRFVTLFPLDPGQVYLGGANQDLITHPAGDTPPGASDAAVFFDYFVDTDSTAMASHTPNTNPIAITDWTQRLGTSEIQSNSVNHSAVDGTELEAVVTTDLNKFEWRAVVDLSIDTAGHEGGLVLRYVDTDNFFAVKVTDSALGIASKASGVWTVLNTTAISVNVGSVYALTVAQTLSGQISANINGLGVDNVTLSHTVAFNVTQDVGKSKVGLFAAAPSSGSGDVTHYSLSFIDDNQNSDISYVEVVNDDFTVGDRSLNGHLATTSGGAWVSNIYIGKDNPTASGTGSGNPLVIEGNEIVVPSNTSGGTERYEMGYPADSGIAGVQNFEVNGTYYMDEASTRMALLVQYIDDDNWIWCEVSHNHISGASLRAWTRVGGATRVEQTPVGTTQDQFPTDLVEYYVRYRFNAGTLTWYLPTLVSGAVRPSVVDATYDLTSISFNQNFTAHSGVGLLGLVADGTGKGAWRDLQIDHYRIADS